MNGSMVFARLRQRAPHLIHDSFGPPAVHNPNGISIGSAVQLTAECPYTLQLATTPLQIAHSHGDLRPQSNT